MNIKPYPIFRTIGSYVLPESLMRRPGSGGTFSSEYCYSVWLRHLHYLIKQGLFQNVTDIKKVAEIGPGDSLGIGISSIYTGASCYYAFDVIEHANFAANSKISEELFFLFRSKTDIPNTKRQINTAPRLSNYDFPVEDLPFDSDYYARRKDLIDRALAKDSNVSVKIEYIVPWINKETINLEDIDLIFSQAVMEHVADIDSSYQEMYRLLRKGGVISHQIDFKTHEMTREWNGHWFIGNRMWNLLGRGRKYPMNRLPISAHIKAIEKVGFKIANILPVTRTNHFAGRSPCVPNVSFTAEDLITSGALIQAVKEA